LIALCQFYLFLQGDHPPKSFIGLEQQITLGLAQLVFGQCFSAFCQLVLFNDLAAGKDGCTNLPTTANCLFLQLQVNLIGDHALLKQGC
jgi:hypothetical protein